MQKVNIIFSGVAIGALSTFRLLGGAVSTAIYSSIVDNQFWDRLPSQLTSAVSAAGLEGIGVGDLIQAATLNTASAYAKVPGITKQVIAISRLAVKHAYVDAYRIVYLTAVGFAGLALISALMCSNVDPAKKTLEKAVMLENEKRQTVLDGACAKV